MAELARGALDPAARARAAAHPSCGAIVTFLGTTRDQHEGREVTRLEYEAHETMAPAALAAIEREALERFAIRSCEVTHRLGVVPPAEASVLVVVAAAHRGAAFDACRWVMDEVKRRVPIWKKEHFSGGDAEWVKGTPLGPG